MKQGYSQERNNILANYVVIEIGDLRSILAFSSHLNILKINRY
jgi:hypothetical protein